MEPPPTADPALRATEVETFLRDFLLAFFPPPAPPAPRRPGRPQLLPTLLLWAGILVVVLRGQARQSDLWRLLCVHGLWQFPCVDVTADAVTRRLQRLSPAPLLAFFQTLTTHLYAQFPPGTPDLAPAFPEVLALDHTVLDPVLRKRQLFRDLPRGHPRLLPGALGCVFDVRRQLWRSLDYTASPTPDLHAALQALVADATPGTLWLFDQGYFSFWGFDQLIADGHEFVTRLRAKVRYETLHVLYDGPALLVGALGETTHLRDSLVYLGQYRSDRAGQPLRLVELTVGQMTYSYLTSVLDPHRLSAGAVCSLYRRRWNIEQAFNLVKTDLQLHFLWSGYPQAVLLQVYATFIIAQVLLALRNQVAHGAKADVREVSLPLLIRWMPQLTADGHDPVVEFIRVGRRAGYIRPLRGKQHLEPDVPLTAYTFPERPVEWREPRYRTGPEGPYRAPARPQPAKIPPPPTPSAASGCPAMSEGIVIY